MNNQNNKLPKLTLVGAGPGDPDLISIKGMKTIADADAILYDALVNPELLAYAPKGIPMIFVGKRKNQPSTPQAEINRLIVEYAFNYGHVVRLKGGDPFVFGRGYEELAYAKLFDIPTHYVPGISSAVSVAGLYGIPVTNRGTSEGFWVVTGTTASGKISTDIALAAQSKSTVVILMGLSNLPEIIELFQQYKSADFPIAIIQNGSLPNAKFISTTLKDIVYKRNEMNLNGPAIIVIGNNVALGKDYLMEYANVIQNKQLF